MGLNGVVVVQILLNVLHSHLLLQISKDLVTLVSEVGNDLLEQVHGLVLAQISEVADVFLEELGRVLFSANVNHKSDQSLEDDDVTLGFSVLEADVKDSQSFLPVAVQGVELLSCLETCFWSCPLAELGLCCLRLCGGLHFN